MLFVGLEAQGERGGGGAGKGLAATAAAGERSGDCRE